MTWTDSTTSTLLLTWMALLRRGSAKFWPKPVKSSFWPPSIRWGKDKTKKKLRKLDVISAFLLIQELSRNQQFKFDKQFSQRLAEHVLASKDGIATGKSTSGPTIMKYYESWRSKIIEEIGVRLDPKRLFDDSDKQTIYETAQGICRICGEHVERTDAEYDHYPIAHAVGGQTTPENGRLMHATCHPRGRPRESDMESDLLASN